jgi:peptide/nickel transport system substrate-binding protein
VRLAANLALDHKTINQALTLGYSLLTNSVFRRISTSTGSRRPRVRCAPRARKLLAEAGHAAGFEAGDYYCDASYANIAEVVLNNLREVGIR